MEKAGILREFSADPDKYYRVKLFDDEGFERRACKKCGRFFWSADTGRMTCPDDSEDTYSFIGDPPTSRRYDYVQAWRQVEDYFVKNDHTSVGRYPVVCRWRDDLYFTIASIVNFQRVMGSKVSFEFPANPLVVPQTCLRFKDLENVGVTGRHFSSFCMVGQHAVPDGGGYWKDRCIELDFGLLTGPFGIPKHEIVFVEDVWSGGGSFGSSLEYFVRGLELGNAVFTEFQGELGRHTTLDQRIIDMGAGLERLSWITMGTPTAYDCCFGPIKDHLMDVLGIDADPDALAIHYTAIAKNSGDEADAGGVRRRTGGTMAGVEGAYMIADHIRTLVFAIADGALPSNVGGGYNLRMMLRRLIATCGRLEMSLDLDELVDMHVDYLKRMYPELDERRADIKTILGIEALRYGESKERMKKIAAKLAGRGSEPKVDELVTLYESDGITPDYLQESGVIREVPPTFYTRLADLHKSGAGPPPEQLPLEGIPETEMLFYGDDPAEFEARVLRSFDGRVILDRTSFYARGGGQEPDHGTIGGLRVTDVTRHAGVIVHMLDGAGPAEGETVKCMVDARRRTDITKNHTSTHLLNASARKTLGSWVWQHSAFKDADHARLDITHHSPLSDEQVRAIEDLANEAITKDIPVSITEHDRGTAEQKYGFRIYQGGVVPVKSVRIVSIGDFDVEACGGTHVNKTGEIGTVRITRAKRIQDGVVRLEFVSGRAAQEYSKLAKKDAAKAREAEAQKEKHNELRERKKELERNAISRLLEDIPKLTGVATIEDVEVGAGPVCFTDNPRYGEYFHINFGKKLVRSYPEAVYCGVFTEGPVVRVVAYAGAKAPAGKDAIAIARGVSEALGGSCGGDATFAQGGGRDTSKKDEAVAKARMMVLGR